MSDKKPLISVIVPIYMIDRYIGICIESIINQTYRNLEIILVDDGSEDRCSEICDLYAEKDRRIKVIHKQNGGLVSARKAGMQAATGDLIGYVDGDDRIGPGFYEAMYTAMYTSGADIVCAGHSRDLFDTSARFNNNVPTGLYEGTRLEWLWERMISYGSYYRPGITTYLWNKLFKRELIEATQMRVDNSISIGEDAAAVYPALLCSKSIYVTDNTAYHYRQREDSMLKKSASYESEAVSLRALYRYMFEWAKDKRYGIKEQITDYVLSICIMRAGGRVPLRDMNAFGCDYKGKNVIIYSAGTFGQQLVNRLKEGNDCNVVGWIDDDYWEYRRCCLDVDPISNITKSEYDYVLIATVDRELAERIKKRLIDYGVSEKKVVAISEPQNRDKLLCRYLNINER